MRGLGFQPIVGFSADDAWLYVYNERGIRKFSVADVTGVAVRSTATPAA